MSTRHHLPDLSLTEHDAVIRIDGSDGRVLRRQRNMAAVRTAVLDLLQAGEQPTLNAIADRAGVATRSVYRYFGDADTAVSDAVEARRRRAVEVFESEPRIGTNASLGDRLGMLVLRRLRLDRLVEPLDTAGGCDELLAALDAEVRAAIAPELAAGDEELKLVLCALFRLPSVRSMREVFGEADQAIASAMMRTATGLLAGHHGTA